MWLLSQILGKQFAGGIDRPIMVMIHRTNHQLRTVNIIEGSTGFAGPVLQQFEGAIVIIWRHAVIHYRTIGNLTGHLHHLITSGADHNLHIAWLTPTVNHIQLNSIDMMEFAMEGHPFHIEQSSQHLHRLTHGG